MRAFIATEAASAATVAQERFGIADAAEQIARFQELYAHWEAVANEVDSDPVHMAQRVYAEVWAHVDFATYGL